MKEKELTNTDARTKQELLFECSSLGSRLSDEIIKNEQLKERINKALNKIDNMFDRGDANTIIDDLLELDKILKGSDNK